MTAPLSTGGQAKASKEKADCEIAAGLPTTHATRSVEAAPHRHTQAAAATGFIRAATITCMTPASAAGSKPNG